MYAFLADLSSRGILACTLRIPRDSSEAEADAGEPETIVTRRVLSVPATPAVALSEVDNDDPEPIPMHDMSFEEPKTAPEPAQHGR
jgi:hypothetical protein